MTYLDKYTIPFSGLSIGRHEFEFEAGNQFFECFEHSEISEGELKIRITLDKKSTMLELIFEVKGEVIVECDICADPMNLPLEFSEKLIVQFGDKPFENTDEILVIPHGEHEINIAQPLFEFIQLSLPAKRQHPEGKCNPEMIKKLKEYTSKKGNQDIDPRWEVLKNIKLN